VFRLSSPSPPLLSSPIFSDNNLAFAPTIPQKTACPSNPSSSHVHLFRFFSSSHRQRTL
jgi:hypothetical protein